MQSTDAYTPISCQVHDRLLALATLGSDCEMEIAAEGGHAERIRGVIEDVYSRDAAEYLRLRGGRTVRLDRLRRIDGHPVPPT